MWLWPALVARAGRFGPAASRRLHSALGGVPHSIHRPCSVETLLEKSAWPPGPWLLPPPSAPPIAQRSPVQGKARCAAAPRPTPQAARAASRHEATASPDQLAAIASAHRVGGSTDTKGTSSEGTRSMG